MHTDENVLRTSNALGNLALYETSIGSDCHIVRQKELLSSRQPEARILRT